MIKIPRLNDRQHRTKNFFLRHSSRRLHVRNDRRLHEIPVSRRASATRNQLPFLLPDLDVFQNSVQRSLAHHRPHVVAGILRRSDGNFFRAFNKFLHE